MRLPLLSRSASAVSAVALLSVLMLSGCGDTWMGESEAPKLAGERLPVLVYDQQLQADPSMANQPVRLPEAVVNADWVSSGGRPEHANGQLALAISPKEAWDSDVGAGVSDENPILAVPIVANGMIFTIDSENQVRASKTDSGDEVWTADLSPEEERGTATGGGLAYSDGMIFATTGYGEVIRLDPADGKIMWRTKTLTPLRSAPSAGAGFVFAVSIDNKLIAMAADSGEVKWTHTGISENAGLLGAPSPALGQSALLVAYSSGELYALRMNNGREIWQDNLASTRREGGVLSIAAIRGQPVLAANGMAAVAMSNSGRIVAIDTRSGGRVWDQRIGGTQMPWVAGDTVYVVSNQAQLIALNLMDGKIRWINQLTQWKNPEDNRGLIAWYGPVLAGGKLWLTNSVGQLRSFDPADGHEVDMIKTGTAINRPPIVAGETLYTLDDSATLTAWR